MKRLYVTTVGETMGFFKTLIRSLCNDACTVNIAANVNESKVPDCYYDCDFFVAIGNPKIRERFFYEILNAGKNIPTLIHPSSSVEENVSIGKGTLIVAGAVINPGTIIGKGCIINTCASVDHDCIISDFAHVSVGAHIAGAVQIGARTWVGAGATVSNNVSICSNCMIGAGAVVVHDIGLPGTYIGAGTQDVIIKY